MLYIYIIYTLYIDHTCTLIFTYTFVRYVCMSRGLSYRVARTLHTAPSGVITDDCFSDIVLCIYMYKMFIIYSGVVSRRLDLQGRYYKVTRLSANIFAHTNIRHTESQNTLRLMYVLLCSNHF